MTQCGAAAVAAPGLGLEAYLRVRVGLEPSVLSGPSKFGLLLLLSWNNVLAK